ncbi:MAG: urate hydroxylase PuuD [Alphaproteobacteria bacterium]
MSNLVSGLLSNLRNTVILSSIITLVVVGGYLQHAGGLDAIFVQAVLRFLHLVFGIMWIGLLYYFNFVQLRKMPEIPAELKPAVSKYIAPEALFWFRWAALLTWVAGVLLAYNRGYLVDAFALGLTSGIPQHSFIGLGMWLATVMFFNVWVFIWPNQKIALGIVEADADAKAKAAKTAMLFSRLNTFLSIPMLATMGMNQTIFG